MTVVKMTTGAAGLVAVYRGREGHPTERTLMFVPQPGYKQLDGKGGTGHIQHRFSYELRVDLKDIDQDAGTGDVSPVQASIQVPDQGGVKQASIVFEKPGVTERKLTGRGGSSHELPINAFEGLLFQARQLSHQTDSCTQPDQVNRFQDLSGIAASLYITTAIFPSTGAGWHVQMEQGRATVRFHRFPASSTSPRSSEA
jgi:hypothetical protein